MSLSYRCHVLFQAERGDVPRCPLFVNSEGEDNPSCTAFSGICRGSVEAMDVASGPHIDHVCRLLRRLHAGGVGETDDAVAPRPHPDRGLRRLRRSLRGCRPSLRPGDAINPVRWGRRRRSQEAKSSCRNQRETRTRFARSMAAARATPILLGLLFLGGFGWRGTERRLTK